MKTLQSNLDLLYITGGNAKQLQPISKQFGTFYKVKHLTVGSEILLDTYFREMKTSSHQYLYKST